MKRATSKHKRLFIPGPTEVRPAIRRAMAKPLIGHRGEDFKLLYADVQSLVREILQTRQRILIGTCAATGMMELAVRNLSCKRILSVICGAFSERCHEVALSCGKAATSLAVEYGRANRAASLRRHLDSGEFDLVTVVYNETSTGVTNPLAEIAAVVKGYPGVLLAVDAVSAMAGLPLPIDGWKLDFCYAGTQKCWALPPVMTMMTVSDAALKRAAQVKDRGYYFDLLRMAEFDRDGFTNVTPNIPLFYALRAQAKSILKTGLKHRIERHAELGGMVRAWGRERFGLFAEPGFESNTVTCLKNSAAWNAPRFNAALASRGYVLGGGYGKLKGSTFRIAHMGDTTPKDIRKLLRLLDRLMAGKA